MTSISIRRKTPLAALLLSTALVFAAPPVLSEQINADAGALIEVSQLQSDWSAAAEAMKEAKAALQAHMAAQAEVEAEIEAQTAKINKGKEGLNAAVLKVAEAKKQLKSVAGARPDTKGDDLAEARDLAEAALNQILADAEAAQSDIATLRTERDGAKATVEEMKKAVSAAKAAASAANLVVEAVKSAQLTIAANESESSGASETGLESEFFTEAMQQAEATQKSAVVAQKALDLTIEREAIVAAKLRDAEGRLATAQKGEKAALKAFSVAREAYDKHAKARAAEEAERQAKLAALTDELSALEEQMQAQASILQRETEVLQEIAARNAEMQSTTDALDGKLASARAVFDTVDTDLRTAQRQRDMQLAAIVAGANAELKRALRGTPSVADSAGSRVTIPAEKMFKSRSAKLTPADGLDTAKLAEAALAVTSGLPEGVDWVLRVDSHAPGKSDEAWFLGQARALALVQAIVTSSGLPVERVSASGFAGADGDGFVELVLTAK